MTRVAKATLAASCIISAAIIWGVHYQQSSEREVRAMFDLYLNITLTFTYATIFGPKRV